VHADAISTIREVWWDVRPHPGFGTVEIRVCDAVPSLREVAAIAAVAQCLAHRFDALIDAGKPPAPAREWTVRQNKWFAARYGMDAELIVDESGDRAPARETIAALVEDLALEAEQLDCTEELDDVLAIVERGPSYVRQRGIVAAGGNLVDVVDSLGRELVSGTWEAS
jgi:carboxylate-amine ligase